MNLYECEFCGKSLDIDDGTLCAVCFVDAHARKAEKQQPTYEQLLAWLNDPKVTNFFESVQKEVSFQRSSWAYLDKHKSPAHFVWLVAHLCAKALVNPEKRKHHIVTAASVLYLWLESEDK